MLITSIKNASNNHDLFSVSKNHLSLSITEFTSQSLTFELPETIRTIPQLIQISGTIRFKGEEVTYHFIGRASLAEGDGVRMVKLNLSQYDKELWNAFLKFQSSRQDRAESIFKTIRGDDAE